MQVCCLVLHGRSVFKYITSGYSLPAEEVVAGVCAPKLKPPNFGASAGLLVAGALAEV